MKKILIYTVGFVLLFITLRIVGSIIFIGIGAAITYFSIKSLIKSPSILGKLWWGLVAIGGISTLFRFMPALVGIAAVVLLCFGYKYWKRKKSPKFSSNASDYSTDFKDFESDWKSIMNKHS